MKFNGRRPYSPITARPPLEWPNGARLAVWVVPNIEHFEAEVLFGATTSTPATEPPDVPNYNWRDYGNRVGVWRTLAMLDRLRIPGTVALNSRVCDLYPEIVAACVERGYEFMGHGRTNSVSINGLSDLEERTMIADVLDTIARATGRRPRGWLGPGLAENDRTPDLLAASGVEYISDWVCDEQPFELETDSGPVVAMPYSVEINDIGIFLKKGFTAPQYAEMLRDQFDVLYEESKTVAKVMCVALHPYITGVPFRAKHLESALAYMRERSDVWFATGGDIMTAYRAQRKVLA